MIQLLALLLAATLALAGCQAGTENDMAEAQPPSPLLYEFSDGKGRPQGWLFGTIHALPKGVKWRTSKLDSAVAEADLLVVEVGNLHNSRLIGETLAQLANTPDQKDIRQRVIKAKRPVLSLMLDRAGFSPADFEDIETWAAALMLAQTQSGGDKKNGADRALLNEFPPSRIRELEGMHLQLGIFDRLPAQDQIDLLTGVIDEFAALQDDPGKLRRAWLRGDKIALIEATQSGILSDPELYEALLAGRNRNWAEQIDMMLRAQERPLVAVGAAHLVGSDGLVSLLRARGHTVTRLQ